MEKNFLTEIKRNKELMGIKNILINESIPIGGLDNLIRFIETKLISKSDNVLERKFNTLMRKAGNNADNKLSNIAIFIDDLADVELKTQLTKKLLDDVVSPQAMNDLDLVIDALKRDVIKPNEIMVLLKDPSQGLLKNSTNKELDELIRNYVETSAKKTAVDVVTPSLNLVAREQKLLDDFIDSIQTKYVNLKGEKRAKVDNLIEQLKKSNKARSPQEQQNILSQLETDISQVKNSELKSMLGELASTVWKYGKKPVAIIATIILLDLGLKEGYGFSFLNPIINLLRTYLPAEDFDKVNKVIEYTYPKKDRIPITQDDAQQNNSNGKKRGKYD
jgi:hypothetical protein